MEKIIKQFTYIILGGAMALNIGCGGAELDKGSSGFAPDSIDGKIATITVVTSDGDLNVLPGSSTITFSGSTYTEVGAAIPLNDTGTYVYTKDAPGMANIVLTSSTHSTVGTVILTFTSYTTGTYAYTLSSGGTGSQSGTFTIN